MMRSDKDKALANYKEARRAYLENRTDKNWRAFCDAKRECMLLGVRI